LNLFRNKAERFYNMRIFRLVIERPQELPRAFIFLARERERVALEGARKKTGLGIVQTGPDIQC